MLALTKNIIECQGKTSPQILKIQIYELFYNLLLACSRFVELKTKNFYRFYRTCNSLQLKSVHHMVFRKREPTTMWCICRVWGPGDCCCRSWIQLDWINCRTPRLISFEHEGVGTTAQTRWAEESSRSTQLLIWIRKPKEYLRFPLFNLIRLIWVYKKVPKQLKATTPPTSKYSNSFKLNEINKALSQTKTGKEM